MRLSRNFLAVVIGVLFLFPVFICGQKASKEQVVKIPKEVAKIIEANLSAPIVSHPLELQFEGKKLDPGDYTLEISIKDKIGKKRAKIGSISS